MLSLKTKRTLFIGLPLFVLIGLGVFMFLKFFIFQQDSLSVNDLLDKADNFISSGYYQEAERILVQAFDSARTDEIMLKIIKRCNTLGELTKNNHLFYSFSKKAYERYPGNKKLLQTALYALLRQGEYNELESLYPDSVESGDIQAIFAEALLRKGDIVSETEKKNIPLYAEYFSSSGIYTPEALLELQKTFNDKRYALDAMLLYMKQGAIDPAYNLSFKVLNNYDFDEPAGLVAYDYGKWEEARARLARVTMNFDKRPDIELILGDIDISLKNYQQAKKRFENSIEYDKDISPNAYINLATILQREGYKEKAEFLLRNAVQKYPESLIAGIEYAKFLFFQGETAKAHDIAEGLLKIYPENEEIQFLLLSFTMYMSSSQDVWIENLHNYFQEYPYDERAAEILVYAFLRYRHIESAQRIMTVWAEASSKDETPWILEAEGIIQALDGNLDTSASIMEKAVRRLDRWDFHYNYGVILLELGRLEDALAEAGAAAFIISTEGTPGKYMIARVLSLQARIKLQQGKYDEAKVIVKKALEYDNTSTEAWELTKILEARK